MAWRDGLPPPTWGAIAGAGTAGVLGAIAGLIIGLRVYAPTAVFAAVELALPSAVLGAVVGALIGAFVTLRRRGVRTATTPAETAGRPHR